MIENKDLDAEVACEAYNCFSYIDSFIVVNDSPYNNSSLFGRDVTKLNQTISGKITNILKSRRRRKS